MRVELELTANTECFDAPTKEWGDAMGLEGPCEAWRAISIRQPYVEAIMRGSKTIDYRSSPPTCVGEYSSMPVKSRHGKK